jgi:hypothetical protein
VLIEAIEDDPGKIGLEVDVRVDLLVGAARWCGLRDGLLGPTGDFAYGNGVFLEQNGCERTILWSSSMTRRACARISAGVIRLPRSARNRKLVDDSLEGEDMPVGFLERSLAFGWGHNPTVEKYVAPTGVSIIGTRFSEANAQRRT